MFVVQLSINLSLVKGNKNGEKYKLYAKMWGEGDGKGNFICGNLSKL